MEIIDPTPDEIPSRLAPLMDPFQSAPFHVAPERSDELVALCNKYDTRIRLRADETDFSKNFGSG